MRRMKIKRAFNLDNVRCFLYGPGQNDDCEDLGLAPTAVLNRRIDEHGSTEPIQNRKTFLDCHFAPTFVQYAQERYLNNKDDKTKQEFFMELCDRRGNKRGTVSFLEELSEVYMCGEAPFSLESLVKTNIQALKSWDVSAFDQQLLLFIDGLIEAEKSESNDSKRSAVCHLLQGIRDIAAINTCTQPSPEDRARALSLLLLGALLREKFPLSLLNEENFHLSQSQYCQIENIYAAVQVNLGLLSSQLTAQESFLREAVRLFEGFTPNGQSHPPALRSLEEYYSLQLWHLARAADLADWTRIADELNASDLSCNREALCFLHGVAFHMDSFAKAGMKQFMEYLTIVTASRVILFGGLSTLVRQYDECLKCFRHLVYWYILSVCHGMPYEITRDMDIIAGYLYPGGRASFPIHVKMSRAKIQSKMEAAEQQFRSTLGTISDNNVTLLFPEIFYKPGFPTQIACGLYQERRVRLLNGECGVPEEVILDVFLSQFSQMDHVCELQENVLRLLSCVVDLPSSEASQAFIQVRSVIDRYRQLMQQILNIPPVVVAEPLRKYMQRKGIKPAEFQNFCATIYSLARDNLRYVDLIERCFVPGAECVQLCSEHHANAVSSLEGTIAWLSTTPNYWFAGWEEKSVSYLRAKCGQLHALSIDWDGWSDTKPGAEYGMAKVLDDIEDKLHKSEREVGKQTWDLMALKLKIEHMIASQTGYPAQSAPGVQE